MARTAVLGGLSWRAATIVALHDESATARTLVLHVPGWPGHVAGQHVDVRLTAQDGYSTVRSYSIANASEGERVELTVEELADGEVSPYLTQTAGIGDAFEIRGPLGGWFVWRASQSESVQLVAGGSGIVPLMAMVRARAQAGSSARFRLLYSVRSPDAVLYAGELRRRATLANDVRVTYAYTRSGPAADGAQRVPGRIDARQLASSAWPADVRPTCYVCGPTPFVETLAGLLTAAGHDPARIRTERFGGGRIVA